MGYLLSFGKNQPFFPSPKLISRIEVWLNEGIDLDPDGQYSERSVGSYSHICNEMFITMGRLLIEEIYWM